MDEKDYGYPEPDDIDLSIDRYFDEDEDFESDAHYGAPQTSAPEALYESTPEVPYERAPEALYESVPEVRHKSTPKTPCKKNKKRRKSDKHDNKCKEMIMSEASGTVASAQAGGEKRARAAHNWPGNARSIHDDVRRAASLFRLFRNGVWRALVQ